MVKNFFKDLVKIEIHNDPEDTKIGGNVIERLLSCLTYEILLTIVCVKRLQHTSSLHEISLGRSKNPQTFFYYGIRSRYLGVMNFMNFQNFWALDGSLLFHTYFKKGLFS